jgi:hypothetical protein
MRATSRRLAALLSLALAPALAAQDEPWKFEGLRHGFCVEFLVDSALIRSLIPGEAMPVRAYQVKELHPVIASTVKERPEYGAWSPASACFYRFDAVQIGGRRQEEDEGEEQGELIGMVSVAARLPQDGGRGADLPLELVTSNWRVRKDASLHNVDFQTTKAKVDRNERPGSDDRLSVKVGGTTLRWEGHAASDSVSPAPAVERRLLLRGSDRKYRVLTWRVEPESRRSLVGSLTVEGKDDLAKALRASPVRFVGPEFRRGNASMLVEEVR